MERLQGHTADKGHSLDVNQTISYLQSPVVYQLCNTIIKLVNDTAALWSIIFFYISISFKTSSRIHMLKITLKFMILVSMFIYMFYYQK